MLAGVVSRAALVRSWADATRAGKSALLVASRNDDVRAMNELARAAVRERIGEERVYATDFGERTFGVGDVLVGRERALGGVNWCGGAMRSGWCEICTSTARSTTAMRRRRIGRKGPTVDSVFALASLVEARRGLYVDITRAHEDVTIAYGKDEVRDFGELLARAQRDQGKILVRDLERIVSVRVERERERQRQRELQRKRVPVIEHQLSRRSIRIETKAVVGGMSR